MMRTHLNGIIGMHQLLSATGLTVEQASHWRRSKETQGAPPPPCPPPPSTPLREFFTAQVHPQTSFPSLR